MLKYCFSTHLRLLPNIGKWDDFIIFFFFKMTYFLENIIAKKKQSVTIE